jgi:hypothetical protein
VTTLQAVGEGVRRIDPGLNPIGDRRPRDRRQPPFPELPRRDEPDGSREPENELDEPDTPAQNDPDTERHIDIRVRPFDVPSMPTGQILPARPSQERIH